MARTAHHLARSTLAHWADRLFAALSMSPAICVGAFCFIALTGWTCLISFTDSDLLPSYDFTGLQQYRRLFSSARWWVTLGNAIAFGAILVIGCSLVGYTLAALIDAGTRASSRIYVGVFLLPLSTSFVVSGVAWRWLLDPSTGLERLVRGLGWQEFQFDWLVTPTHSIYAVALVGVWQQCGMCMVLFLAAFRGLDPNVLRASRLDGASAWRTHIQIVMPALSHVFAISFALLSSVAVKSFDLIVVLTSGGPGFSSDVPARFVMEHIFERQELALGAAATCIMVLSVVLAMVPYLYLAWHRQRSIA